jgi:hypothetical protein
MSVILQEHLPVAPWMDARTARLPGVMPVQGDDWLRVDEAFAGQMGERDRLIAERPVSVHALEDAGRAAADELLDVVLARLRGTQGYEVGADRVTRPDGVCVMLARGEPLLTLGRLVQEDLCLLQKQGEEHVLTGAVLCFPASWTLAQKIGRPLRIIHAPVVPYTDDIARRVQRMFDAVRTGQPLVRMNALVYDDPTLHQPRLETERRPRPVKGLYMRSERQCLIRLPQTQAVVFAIHTYVVLVSSLSEEVRAGLETAGL